MALYFEVRRQAYNIDEVFNLLTSVISKVENITANKEIIKLRISKKEPKSIKIIINIDKHHRWIMNFWFNQDRWMYSGEYVKKDDYIHYVLCDFLDKLREIGSLVEFEDEIYESGKTNAERFDTIKLNDKIYFGKVNLTYDNVTIGDIIKDLGKHISIEFKDPTDQSFYEL